MTARGVFYTCFGFMLVVVLALPAASALPARKASEPAEARRLARSLVTASNLRAAVAATTEALQRGGISVVRGKRVVARGRTPLATNRLELYQAVQMAMEARRANAGSLTLRDFGRLLAAAQVVPRSKSDRFMVALMNGWVRDARSNAANPHAFVPLFLAELAQRQLPQVDLGRAFRPQDVQLTALEMVLMATAIDRGIPTKRARAIVRTPSAFRPCEAINDLTDPLGLGVGPVNLEGKPFATYNDVLKRAVKDAITKFAQGDRNAATVATTIFKLMKIVNKWESLMLFYRSAEIRPFPQPNEVRRPAGGRPVRAGFSAVAGLNDQAKKELEKAWISRSSFVRALRDCADAAGIPVADDVQDIADSLDEKGRAWRVHWSEFGWPQNVFRANSLALVSGSPPNKFTAGQFRHKLIRITETEGAPSSPLYIDVQPERADIANDPDSVEIREAWGVRADLVSSQPPDPKFIRKMIQEAVTGDWVGFGLEVAKTVNDILVEWTRAVVTPSNKTTMTIVSHVPCTQRLARMIQLQAFQQVGGPTCGPPKAWVGTVQGKHHETCCPPPDVGLLDMQETWTAQVRFAQPQLLSGSIWVYAATGRVEWNVTGKSGDCTVRGSGSTPIVKVTAPGSGKAVFGQLGLHQEGGRSAYSVTLTGVPAEASPVTYSGCEGGGPLNQSFMGFTLHVPERPMGRNDMVLAGSATLGDSDGVETYTWQFRAVK